MSETEQPVREEFPKIDNKYLTLFEQRFIGGSERIGDEFYDLNKYLKDFEEGKGQLPEIYRKTMAEIRGEADAVKVEEERSTHCLKGIFSFLGESGIDVLEQGYDTVIQFKGRNKAVLKLVPNKIGLTDNNLEKALSTIKPAGKLARSLHLEPSDGLIEIRPKTWEEYNAV